MKLRSPFWQVSLITFLVMISGYVGMMLCNGTKDSPGMFLGVLFVILMVVGAFSFAASLLWWLLAIIVSGIHSRRAKS
jgi:hypothetical protein